MMINIILHNNLNIRFIMTYCKSYNFSIPHQSVCLEENHPRENIKHLTPIEKLAIENLASLETPSSTTNLKRKSIEQVDFPQKRQKVEKSISEESEITEDEMDADKLDSHVDEIDAKKSVRRRQWRKQPNQFWTTEEDQVLLNAIKPYANEPKILWGNVAAEVKALRPRVKANACRKRYELNLDPSINKGPWTEEEYKELITIVRGYNETVSWTQVAKKLPTHRTSQMCRQTYLSLISGTLKPIGDRILNSLK